jgi:hypothetical protein
MIVPVQWYASVPETTVNGWSVQYGFFRHRYHKMNLQTFPARISCNWLIAESLKLPLPPPPGGTPENNSSSRGTLVYKNEYLCVCVWRLLAHGDYSNIFDCRTKVVAIYCGVYLSCFAVFQNSHVLRDFAGFRCGWTEFFRLLGYYAI